MEISPVVLFVYNRLEHTKKVIDALSKNRDAEITNLIVYSDGSKGYHDNNVVNEIRTYLKSISQFKSVSLNFREKNFGLFQNIKLGLTDVFNNYNSVIVLEDDLVPSLNFLSYMNSGLNFYKEKKNIGAISAFQFPIIEEIKIEEDIYLHPRFSCWGWATWKDRWDSWEWHLPERKTFLKKREPLKSLHAVSNDLPELILDKIDRLNSSWSVYVCYEFVRKNLLCVYPTISKIQNIGFDGSGIHSLRDNSFSVNLDSGNKFVFKFTNEINKSFERAHYQYFRNSWKRKLKNLLRYGRWF